MTIDRRVLLKALVAAPLATVAPSADAATAVRAATAFDRASQALTGFASPSTSDTNAMFAAFATTERRAALARLARIVADTPPDHLDDALRTHALDKLADDLVAAWYSGSVTHGKQQRLVLYTD